MMDKSNGYEGIAEIFVKGRGRAINGIGTSTLRKWAKDLSPGSVALDLGCGTGVPVSKILMDAGMQVYGVDASHTMVREFRRNFPDLPVACEAAEESSFFDRKFDVVVAWGLMFLLPVNSQITLVGKMGTALNSGGRMLFTSPAKPLIWNDAMTEQESRSLGADRYKELISEAGLTMIEEFEDEGENHYYYAVKNEGTKREIVQPTQLEEKKPHKN